ncbi:MAG: hypothetical protein WDN24_09595 [Sphingomonas sp.]
MRNFLRSIRQALTIARRDFVATVYTPTFLLFLLAPVFMLTFGLVGGLGASGAAGSGEARLRMVVIAPAERASEITAIDSQLRRLFPSSGDNARPELRIDAPGGNVAAQARALFDQSDYDIAAVLYGPFERPHILRAQRGRGEAAYLAELAEQVLRTEKAGGTQQLSQAEVSVITRAQSSASGRSQVAYFAVLGVFLLTLMLSGQAVGAMAEERSNK